MRMTMPRVRTSDLPILPFLYRFSLVRVVMNAITTVFVLQVITVIVLEAVAARRKRQNVRPATTSETALRRDRW